MMNISVIIYMSFRGRGTYMAGRNGKFRPTFKSGPEKGPFSVPLLMTWCPKSTKLQSSCTHVFTNNFLGLTLRVQDQQNWGGSKAPQAPPSTTPTVQLFQSFRGRWCRSFTWIRHTAPFYKTAYHTVTPTTSPRCTTTQCPIHWRELDSEWQKVRD